MTKKRDVTRRTTLVERPANPQYMDESGRLLTTYESERLMAENIKIIRLVPDEEMEERIRLCEEMIDREARRHADSKISKEEMKANAVYALWRAARTDKWKPEISIEGYSRQWVQQVCRREKQRRNRILKVPLKKRWFCVDLECPHHQEGVDAKRNANGDAPCPLCGSPLEHRPPPKIVSIGPTDDDETSVDVPDKGMPEELKVMAKRLFEVMRESANSPTQRDIVEDLLVGLDPIDIARNRNVSRQLIHVLVDKIRGRAMQVILQEYPREDVDRMFGRKVVDKVLETTKRLEMRASARKERKAKERQDNLNQARILAGQEPEGG